MNRIIYISLVLIVVMGLVSFWVNPAYEKGVWIAILAVTNTLSAACGCKFGLSIPRTEDASGTKKLLDPDTPPGSGTAGGGSGGVGLPAV